MHSKKFADSFRQLWKESFSDFVFEVKHTYQTGEPFHLSMTFPLARLLFLPCLALVALRMLTCFLSHSLIWHVCKASPPRKTMRLQPPWKAGELSEKACFCMISVSVSHTTVLNCRKLFLCSEKKKLDAYWILQQHPPRNLHPAFCCKKSISDEGGQATWQVTTSVKIMSSTKNPLTQLCLLLAPAALFATILHTYVHKEKIIHKPKTETNSHKRLTLSCSKEELNCRLRGHSHSASFCIKRCSQAFLLHDNFWNQVWTEKSTIFINLLCKKVSLHLQLLSRIYFITYWYLVSVNRYNIVTQSIATLQCIHPPTPHPY